ncbi:hypothetical protein ScPMuIL_004010 [Solemya velum]
MWKSTLFLALTVCLMFTMNIESVDALASRGKDDNDFLPFLMLMMMMNGGGFGNQKQQQPQVIFAQPGMGYGIGSGYGY